MARQYDYWLHGKSNKFTHTHTYTAYNVQFTQRKKLLGDSERTNKKKTTKKRAREKCGWLNLEKYGE